MFQKDYVVGFKNFVLKCYHYQCGNIFDLSSPFGNSILYIEGEKCMIFPKVQFVARERSPRATKHRGKNEHSLQKYIYYFFHSRE
jgi:hypothetical protein